MRSSQPGGNGSTAGGVLEAGIAGGVFVGGDETGGGLFGGGIAGGVLVGGGLFWGLGN